MRKFETGGVRDESDSKLDFDGFLSIEVLESFANYMHGHRIQADGKLRSSSNWKNLFGEDHYNICAKSLWRHFVDFVFIHTGHKRYDKKDGHEIGVEEACCAMIFNVQSYLYKFLKEKSGESEKTPPTFYNNKTLK